MASQPKFSAPTDFKVGEAVRYLQSRGFGVRIKYKESEDRKRQERKIIGILQKTSRLLNELEGFNYNLSNEESERARLHRFLETLIRERGTRTDGNTNSYHEETETSTTFPAEEGGKDQTCKPFPSGGGGINQTLVEGSITSQGVYKTDNKEICELYFSKESADALPHECGQKKPISLVIGETTYEAGVHETQEGVVWLSSVLKKGARGEKARLVDVLEGIGLRRGDRVTLQKNADGIFVLKGNRWP